MKSLDSSRMGTMFGVPVLASDGNQRFRGERQNPLKSMFSLSVLAKNSETCRAATLSGRRFPAAPGVIGLCRVLGSGTERNGGRMARLSKPPARVWNQLRGKTSSLQYAFRWLRVIAVRRLIRQGKGPSQILNVRVRPYSIS